MGASGKYAPSVSAPAKAPIASTTPAPVASAKQATLYGPNGQKQVVDVGSTQASQLQSQGWGLTVGSYKSPIAPTITPSTNNPAPIVPQDNTLQSGQSYQILNPSDLTKYKPTDYTKNADGTIFLNSGVTPIAGTTKIVATPASPAVPDNPASGATSSQSMIDYMISIDPYLQDYFSDPANKAKFDTLDPALQSTFLQLIDVKQKNIAAGKIVNPDVTLEPAKMAEFLQTAKDQLDPYYQEQLKNAEGNLTTSIQRLQDDYNTSIGRSQDTFKQNLGTQAESEAQAGLTYGSERGVRLSRTVQNENNALTDAATQNQRSLQDTATDAERSIGSTNLAGLGINYNTPTYTADANGYNSTGGRSLFTPSGNLTGSMQNEQTTNEILKQQQLAAAENAKRTADYNFQVNSINA
jgi:hypothetical protein